MTTDISAMSPEQKRLFKIYGNHTRSCAKQRWLDHHYGIEEGWPTQPPDCDCGWLEALGAACGGAEGA